MSKLKIGAITYRIKKKSNFGFMGQTIWNKSEVHIQKKMEKRITRETLLHEIVHIALMQTGHHVEVDEAEIDAVAYVLLDSGLIDKKKLKRLLK